MRILWVKLGGLWPLDAGGRIRSFQMIEELATRHEVSVITTEAPGESSVPLHRMLPRCRAVTTVPYTPRKRASLRFLALLVRSWFSPRPVDVWRWRVPSFRAAVADALASGEHDLCVADFLVAVPNLPARMAVPVILFEHNVEYVIWQRLGRTVTAWQRPLIALEWRKLKRYESQALARAAVTVAVSGEDRAELERIAPRAEVRSIPTGVDAGYYAPATDPEIPDRLVFVGAMDWYPNEDAAVYLIEAILPLIRARVPGISLTIVGRNPSARLCAAGVDAAVSVTGTVPDVRPYVHEAEVVVVPLRIGGGTRLKIFEALAMEKAVVSTTVGAEGLPLRHGEHLLIADDPASFADRVVSLLRTPALRRQVGAAGRRLVADGHSWRQVCRDFERHCLDVLEARTVDAPGPVA
ncbi:MAG: glycosyltransferase family 4 protein [Solirubrobacteraceae bacterium]